MSDLVNLRPRFWERFALHQLTKAEWEALCDGCGACCLIKFEDDETGMVQYTDVACRLLDCHTGSCQHYENRHQFVPDCISLSLENIATIPWLPATCAYKRLFLGQPLPSWHYLITQDTVLTKHLMEQHQISVANRCISEEVIFDEYEQETRVIHWISQS